VKLTDEERVFIARRAAGEYGIVPAVERILRANRKNRNPDDRVFLDFARLILQKRLPPAEYERLGKAILAIIPEPFGTPWWKKKPEPPKWSKPSKRQITCRICSQPGHNARTCPDKPKDGSSTVDCADGLTRLAPGFDPNPPERVEESND